MKVKIDIDTATFVRFGLVILGFVVALLIVYKTRSALTILGVALFLALALNPPVSLISRRLPGNSRVGATAIAYLVVVSLLGGFLFMVVPPVIEQTSKFAETVPSIIDDVSKNRTVFDDFIQRYGLEETADKAVENAKDQASSLAANLGNLLIGGAGVLFNGVANLIFVLVLAFLMLIEGPSWLRKLWGMYQDPELLERHRTMINKMYRVVTGFVNGQLTVAAIAAVCSLVVILLFSTTIGFPANIALPLATIVFLSGMIPMIGSTIGGTLVALVLLFNSPLAALFFVIYFIVYQQIENNFIAPTIQAKSVELSALAILAAILIGVSLAGLLGGIIAIPVAGCLRVLLIDYLEHSRRVRAEKTPKGVLKKLTDKL
jgi:predicted PurR-regulated permease PerM